MTIHRGPNGFQMPLGENMPPDSVRRANQHGDVILSARVRTNRLLKEDIDSVVQVLLGAISEQLKDRIKRGIQVRQADNGEFEVKTEFVCIRLDEWERMIGKVPDFGKTPPRKM